MNNGQIYNTVVALLRKEARGNIVKPERFTSLLQLCHWELYNAEYQKYKDSKDYLSSLRPFIVTGESITVIDGEFAISGLAKGFQHLISARVANGGYTCDIVTPDKFDNFYDDPLMGGISSNPLMTVDGTNLKIHPITTTPGQSIKVSYLKKPDNDPYFDYYIDSNRNIQYIEEGATLNVPSGAVYRDGSTGPITEGTSLSYDLVWDDPEISIIINMMLAKLGVTLSEPSLVKYATDRTEQTN